MPVSALSPRKKQILRVIMGAPERTASLSEISKTLKISPPAALHHLRELVRDGLLDRTPVGHYIVVPTLAALSIDPTRGVVEEWVSHEPVSWRFPLVARVPDRAAQRVLKRFLEEVDRRGLLVPWVLPPDRAPPHRDDGPTEVLGMTLLVYGSCARGESSPRSDLDLLVVQRGRYDLKPALSDLAAEANLWAERQLDLRVLWLDEFDALPERLRMPMQREGIVVFGEPLEAATGAPS